MDIYAILIMISALAIIALAWLFIQRLFLRDRDIKTKLNDIANSVERLNKQVEFHARESGEKVMGKVDETYSGTLAAVEELRLSAIAAIDALRSSTLSAINESRLSGFATVSDAYLSQPQRRADDDMNIVNRVEMTLKEIQALAEEMKDSAKPSSALDQSNDARLWTLVGNLRSDAADARDSLERAQKRLRQLGDAVDDSMRKLRALERRVRQAKRQERQQALPAPDQGDGDDELEL